MTNKAEIKYLNIGNYLSRKEKLKTLTELKSIYNNNIEWEAITPNKENDWLNLRNDIFSTFIPIEPDKKFNTKTQSYFIMNSLGIATSRDSWVYNFSKNKLENNMKSMINCYNEEIEKDNKTLDKAKISWNDSLMNLCEKKVKLEYNKLEITNGIYRPFCKQLLYYDKTFIQRTYQQLKLFPTKEHKNTTICVSGLGGGKDSSTFITNKVLDLNVLDAGTQCFPLYYYEKVEPTTAGLFDKIEQGTYRKHDAVSDFILNRVHETFGDKFTKEDIFYYVYGLLHSPIYREKFAVDLKKMLPRIPLVKKFQEFEAFIKAGRELAELHLNYEDVPACKNVKIQYLSPINKEEPKKERVVNFDLKNLDKEELFNYYRVEKIKFKDKKDKSCIVYNENITLENIPLKAYDYVVNGKPAVEWILDRYDVSTNKDTQITNDANDWAVEVDKPSYILDLLLSVVELSVKSVEIVDGLPVVEFEDNKDNKDNNDN